MLSLFLVNESAYALTTHELFTKLEENNLMLKEEQHNLKSIEAASTTTWSSPELAISEMNANTPFIDSEMKMQRSIEVSQMLPNPIRLSANKSIKGSAEQVQRDQISVVLKNIKAEAYKIFLGLYQNQRENEIYSQKKIQLEKFFDRLRSTQVQGQEEKIQISEAQSETQELKLNITINLNEKKRMRSMLNQMLNIDLNTELTEPVLDEIVITKKRHSQTSSEIKVLDSKISLMQSDLSMKNSEFYPEFILKAKFNKSYTPAIESSKEIMVGITLPFLFWGQQQNGINSTCYKIEAMKAAKSNQLSIIANRYEILLSEMEDLQSNLKFLKESSLPIKEKKMKIFFNYSYTDMKSLMNYKMSFDDVYMLKMKILEKEMELQKKYYEWTQLEG
jgi:hypothetical protein